MKKLYMALDLGSSVIKVLYTHEEPTECPNYLKVEPEVIEMNDSESDRHRSDPRLDEFPLNKVFVSVDDTYYAIGELAREQLRATANIQELKLNYAVPRTLGAVFAAAHKSGLGKKYALYITCLLPPGEVKDGDSFYQQLNAALKSFDTPTGIHNVSLKYFNCAAEGVGLALFFDKYQPNPPERSRGILMMGHRNMSFFVERNKRYQKLKSSDLGFAQVVSDIQSETSGYKERDLTKVVARYLVSKDKNSAILQSLLLKTPKLRDAELASLIEEIEKAKTAFWNAAKQWLSIQTIGVDEIIIGGGVARIFERELAIYFKDKLPNLPDKNYSGVYLYGNLKYPANTKIPIELQDRFTDVQGLWERDLIPNCLSSSRKKE